MTALFILDAYSEVYVWEGWKPEEDDNVQTGSARRRWDKDRQLAMRSALTYAQGKDQPLWRERGWRNVGRDSMAQWFGFWIGVQLSRAQTPLLPLTLSVLVKSPNLKKLNLLDLYELIVTMLSKSCVKILSYIATL